MEDGERVSRFLHRQIRTEEDFEVSERGREKGDDRNLTWGPRDAKQTNMNEKSQIAAHHISPTSHKAAVSTLKRKSDIALWYAVHTPYVPVCGKGEAPFERHVVMSPEIRQRGARKSP